MTLPLQRFQTEATRTDRFRLLTAEEKDQLFEQIKANCDVTPDGCWAWRGARSKAGYGLAYIQGKMRTVSRFMLCYVTRESLHVKADACHEDCCPIRHCVNPLHLKWGTHKHNCREKEATQFRFGANARKKSRCLSIPKHPNSEAVS